ncbi:glycosyltransferase family 4 protein [Leptolyngbya sp. FACHB-711]|uniref:glycosyltransferase family 4 protein n=1 Tax=Leptolyngbya sp. FACHB-711 TaxID=2692813 RepID=UPI001681EACB|nr:glycosyltransferase family 4 protein [Leptolyngbya sp. FACHB-711]MBD2028210.1 glycosyltransferase family 4 protein [Leptolyngbya sp. FACHB-711]
MNCSSWICCQLGAREHYAIPRSLHQTGQLTSLITDAWIPPNSAFNALPSSLLRNLRDRFHPDLKTASVQAFTASLLQFELSQKLKKTGEWERMIARNNWFQQRVIRQLQTMVPQFSAAGIRPTLFTYSYAALEILKYAKSQGWQTVLGQIDPGPVEEEIVIREHQKYPSLAPSWQPVPPSYWETWKQECEITDRIIVNSNWSRQALQQAGINTDKIEIVPLAYSPPEAARSFQRVYPDKFSAERPLRVLFLGQVILRKGIAALLEAADKLKDEPIEFLIVGAIGIDRSQINLPNIRWFGAVPRSEAAQYYQQADVFLFPTMSDGFGLTQLEAQAWKLPLIVSRFCGEVVKDGVNGLVLPEVAGESIADALIGLIIKPTQFNDLSSACSKLFQCSKTLSEQLKNI